jgi:hypothetical protein
MAKLARGCSASARDAVAEFEDAEAAGFLTVPQDSTKAADLIETEAIENRHSGYRPGIRLGRRCAPLWCIFRFNTLEIEGVEW